MLRELEEIADNAKQAKALKDTDLVNKLEAQFDGVADTTRRNNAVMNSRKELRAEIRRLEKIRNQHREFKKEVLATRNEAIREINKDVNKRMRSVINSTTLGEVKKERLTEILKRVKAESDEQLVTNYKQLLEQHDELEKELNELIRKLNRQHKTLEKGKLRVLRNEKANIGDTVEMAGEKDLSSRIRGLRRVFKDQTKSTP